MRRILFNGIVSLALALAAPAGAMRPKHADFWNGSHVNGASFSTSKSGRTIEWLQFFCKHTRYDLEENVHVRKDGTFSYAGRSRKYGHEAEPLGVFRARLHGRFTSRGEAKIKRYLPDCGGATVRVKATS